MLFAFLTTALFAIGAVSARLLVTRLGSMLANLLRLAVATVFLTVWAYAWGRGTEGPGFAWFVLSGIVGFGFGDIALYFALPRIGARLTMLLSQCLAAPFAALVEWLWLGTTLTPLEVLLGAIVLGGIALALVPKDNLHIDPGQLVPGVIFGILAGAGQGGGAVLSRKAFELSLASGIEIDGGTAAFQRVIGGVFVGWIAWMLLRKRPDEKRSRDIWPVFREARSATLLMITALFGPVIGVACFQWALSTAPSGIVLPIVGLTPIVIIPISYWLEGDRPKPRSILGGVIAVAAAIALAAL
jgi:drug/metabolite transporter (DMT)-like permease